MKDIVQAIKEKRSAIARLQRDLDVLERAHALLEGGTVEQPSTLSVSAHESIRPKESKRVRIHPRKGKFSPRSSVGQAVAVLRESGVPMHVDEILNGIKKRGAQAKKTSLASTLARLSKLGRLFIRAQQPNTFGLIEWGSAKQVA